MLKWFTNNFDKQVAIDSRHVTSVYETEVEGYRTTVVNTINSSIQLKEPILDVVTRLNERD
jgi:hypothetical protein